MHFLVPNSFMGHSIKEENSLMCTFDTGLPYAFWFWLSCFCLVIKHFSRNDLMSCSMLAGSRVPSCRPTRTSCRVYSARQKHRLTPLRFEDIAMCTIQALAQENEKPSDNPRRPASTCHLVPHNQRVSPVNC